MRGMTCLGTMILLLCAASASAETLKLKSGEKIQGSIIDDNGRQVVLESRGEVLSYSWDDIREISRQTVPEMTIKGAEPVPADTAERDLLENAGTPPSGSMPDRAFGIEGQGFQEVRWGQKLSEVDGLAYAFTDPASGADIYIYPQKPLMDNRDWDGTAQYHFWNQGLFKIRLPVKSQEEWLALQEQLADTYGPGYHLAGAKDVWQWDADETILVLRFDASSQSGYFTAESKQISRQEGLERSSGIRTLIAALQVRDTDVRARAAVSLAMMKDERATMPLVALLKDENFIVRYNVAAALGEIRDPRAVEPLIAALDDEDTLVRAFAAEALGKIGDLRAVEPLINRVAENDSAMEALEKMTGQRFGTQRETWRAWWQHQKTPEAGKVAL